MVRWSCPQLSDLQLNDLWLVDSPVPGALTPQDNARFWDSQNSFHSQTVSHSWKHAALHDVSIKMNSAMASACTCCIPLLLLTTRGNLWSSLAPDRRMIYVSWVTQPHMTWCLHHASSHPIEVFEECIQMLWMRAPWRNGQCILSTWPLSQCHCSHYKCLRLSLWFSTWQLTRMLLVSNSSMLKIMLEPIWRENVRGHAWTEHMGLTDTVTATLINTCSSGNPQACSRMESHSEVHKSLRSCHETIQSAYHRAWSSSF